MTSKLSYGSVKSYKRNGAPSKKVFIPAPLKNKKTSFEKQPLFKNNGSGELLKKDDFSGTEDYSLHSKKLLLVSSQCKYGALLEKAVKSNVTAILYNYNSHTFDSLLALISASLRPEEKVSSVGCIMNCKHAGIFMLCSQDSTTVLNANTTVIKTTGIGLFFRLLFNNFVDKNQDDCRLDFFGGAVVNQLDKHFNTLLEITGAKSIGVSKGQLGTGRTTSTSGDSKSLGDIYFTPDKIRNWSNGTYQTLDLFEKIRTVGKGAFGTAVLYRKKDDNSLVILKEINMSELNSQERQLAMNETKVLKMLNHPNIICCYDSFEENGVLMIEMEYADNGTLAQFLAKQDSPLSETVILNMFCQITCGIRYMHEQKVLHRDLKTANIFMMKEGLLKIGDFGVSKIMNTHMKGANTVLGTPYYISPEICEGKAYNEKSDIWALGCILHEMATQQKTFESTNLPALVNKIMRGNIAPIQGNYSEEFKLLVRDMLHREPSERPTAQVLNLIRIPDLLERFAESEDSFHACKTSSKYRRKMSSASRRETRSVLYHFDTSTLAISPIDGFPLKIKIQHVAVGENHFIALATEMIVYSWGKNDHGQLGHGNMEPHLKPTVVEALNGKSVTSACAGSSFSVFLSDNGILMTCGDGRYGCLGHGDLVSTQRPRLIESLLSVDVSVVACGSKHVIALSNENKVFAWGDGKDGCLGLGNMDIKEVPTAVNVGNGVTVRDVKCGADGTMFITDVGTLLACGSNKYNKLGLNERRGFLSVLGNRLKLEVDCKKSPTPIRTVKGVVDVSMGKFHTAVLTENGECYMLGNNKYGQLGTGDTKVIGTPHLMKYLNSANISAIICGDSYTVAANSDGSVHFWGTRYQSPICCDNSRTASITDMPSDIEIAKDAKSSINNNNLSVQLTHKRSHSSTSTISCKSNISLSNEATASSEEQSFISNIQDISNCTSEQDSIFGTTNEFDLERNGTSASTITSSTADLKVSDIVYKPKPILRIHGPYPDIETEAVLSTPDSAMRSLGSSKSVSDEISSCTCGIPSSEFAVFLDLLIPCHEDFYLLVSTNSPATSIRATEVSGIKKASEKSLNTQISRLNLMVPCQNDRVSISSCETGDEYIGSEASEIDSLGTAATWIREELRKSIEVVTVEKVRVKNGIKNKLIEKRDSKPVMSPKESGSHSANKARSGKSIGVSNCEIDSRSVMHKSVTALTYKLPEKERSGRKSHTSFCDQDHTQAKFIKKNPGRNQSKIRHNWDSPRRSHSPLRTTNNIHSLREKVARLQIEKMEAERKLTEVRDRNENFLRELQVRHEKEKLEQERWLHDQIAMLKKQLDEQQREINDSALNHAGYSSQSKRNESKPSSLLKANSKICTLQ